MHYILVSGISLSFDWFFLTSFYVIFGYRIDAEASDLKKRLEGMKALQNSSNEALEQASEKTTKATIEVSLVIVVACFCLLFLVWILYC